MARLNARRRREKALHEALIGLKKAYNPTTQSSTGLLRSSTGKKVMPSSMKAPRFLWEGKGKLVKSTPKRWGEK